MPRHFSQATEDLIRRLDPSSRPTGVAHYPPEHDGNVGRIDPTESVGAWFHRCVDHCGQGDPTRYALNVGLSVFVTVVWGPSHGQRHITYLNAQAVVTPDVDLLYLDPQTPATYLRFDFDASQLGELFSHPVPHLHVGHAGPDDTRVVLDAIRSTNPLPDFLDFLLRNYFNDDWRRWVHGLWGDHLVEAGRVALADDVFPDVERRFRENQPTEVQARHTADLALMRRLIRRAKREMYPLRLADQHSRLFSYLA